MIKLVRYLPLLLILALLAACQDNALVDNTRPVEVDENGNITLRFSTQIPDMQEVVTRAVDPDGYGVRTLWLFCFDSYRHYIGHVQATDIEQTVSGGGNTSDGTLDNNLSGSFQATIPGATRYIHFIANLNVNDFEDTPNLGRLDTEVIPEFTTTSGLLSYWGYMHFATEEELTSFAGGTGDVVQMFRNQARFQHHREGSGENLSIKGYVLVNEYSRGTVAPYNRKTGENADPFAFADAAAIAEPTLCAEEDKLVATTPTDVTRYSEGGDARFAFEHENSANNPMFAIFRINTEGGESEDTQWEENDRYYKIALVDDNGDYFPILRNHLYTFHFTGIPERMGYATFEEALNGDAANNVWVSIDQTIAGISDSKSELKVTGATTRIITPETINADGTYTIRYTWFGGSGNNTTPEVTWTEGGNTGIAESRIENDFQAGTSLDNPGEGTITIFPLNIGSPQYGSLQIKAGKFVRTVNLISLTNFSFTPVWTSSGVPERTGQPVAIAFTIPEDFPEELFPLDVKISANLFDDNGTNVDMNGNQTYLDVVFEECNFKLADGAIEEKRDWSYKYVYTVDRPGLHRVNFETVLNDYEANENEAPRIEFFLEAEAFTTIRQYIYMAGSNQINYIRVGLDNANNGVTWTTDLNNNAEVHVPPIAGQEFNLHLQFVNTSGNVFWPNNDERVDLRIYVDKDKIQAKSTGTDLRECDTPDPERGFYYIYTMPSTQPGNYANTGITIPMVTQSTDCASYIRIAAHNVDAAAGNNSENTYRSTILTTRNSTSGQAGGADAYVFTATLNYGSSTGSSVEIPYGPGEAVTLNVDIPQEIFDFNGNKSVTVFVATTILSPADEETRLKAVEGGYTFTTDQANVTLLFQTNTVASAETITLSEYDNKVAFTPAELTITNRQITGSVTFAEGSDGEFLLESPYLSLERKDGTRLGVCNATRDESNHKHATFTLTLRTEYPLDMDEEIYVRFSPYPIGHTEYYQGSVTLRRLQNDEEVVLEKGTL